MVYLVSMSQNTAYRCKPLVRPLYAWEIHEARRVFGSQLRYERIRIHECAGWLESLDRLGARLKGIPYTGSPSAITLGYHIYFPEPLPSNPPRPEHPEHRKVCWLIHELTHAWQYQWMGWRYLALALQAQFRLGTAAYDFGGEAGLTLCSMRGGGLADFNLEQQGDIARTYYEHLVRGQDTTAWKPFIAQIQKFDQFA